MPKKKLAWSKVSTIVKKLLHAVSFPVVFFFEVPPLPSTKSA
jgi:hypothetical protein